jgi:hypothetical protein
VASLVSIEAGVTVALVELTLGVAVDNVFDLPGCGYAHGGRLRGCVHQWQCNAFGRVVSTTASSGTCTLRHSETEKTKSRPPASPR